MPDYVSRTLQTLPGGAPLAAGERATLPAKVGDPLVEQGRLARLPKPSRSRRQSSTTVDVPLPEADASAVAPDTPEDS
ncbi:MAG: hypothetical protein AB7G37_00930 [Solirubrobacteraceae bacterium]